LLDRPLRFEREIDVKNRAILNSNHYRIGCLNKLMHFGFMDDIARQAAEKFAIALDSVARISEFPE
jgi:hypothetical protein